MTAPSGTATDFKGPRALVAASNALPSASTPGLSAPRLRHSLLGLALALLAIALCAGLGLWLVAAIFHTAPGALS